MKQQELYYIIAYFFYGGMISFGGEKWVNLKNDNIYG